ncbi:MAG: integrase [Deltaproteobacteria bacterium]|nr:integrase [Deltaproteobacteria bacterium]
MTFPSLPALLQAFFTTRLTRERNATPDTIAAYRDAFRLLLRFAAERLSKAPSNFAVTDLDAALVSAFLDHIENTRGNGARTRNARLAAIHAFFRYVALQEPEYALHCQRVLSIPGKRYEQKPLAYLTRLECEALLAAPDRSTWLGRRDHALLLLVIQTGLRVSELTGLRCQDVVLGTGAHVRCSGKGRKERATPLREEAIAALEDWLRERQGKADQPLFPTRKGGILSSDAVQRLVAKFAAQASKACPSIERKHVTPHVLRHTAAMDLLQHGVDRTVIALWLGHESVETTQIYLHADQRLKEQALSRTTPLGVTPGRYRPDDDLLAFLEGL